MKLTQLIPILLLPLPTLGSATSNIDATDKYAWSTNAGWVNFSPANGGVTVATDHLEGYAWAENIGWIKLGTYTGGGSHTYSNTSATDYGVNRDSAGNLSGYAWSTNVGWINFKPTNGGVTVNQTTGQFDGYAWSENVGWIHFQNASPAYTVKATGTSNGTSNTPPGSTSNGTSNTPPGTSNGTSNTPPLPENLSLHIHLEGSGHGKVTTDTGMSCHSSDCQVDKTGEIECNPQACTQLVKTGSEVTLTPQADADSVFSSWGGADHCNDGKVFMNSSYWCIAYFHRIYSLTVATQGPGQITGYSDYNQQPIIDCGSKCQTSVSEGTRISLQATPSQGMVFGGWSGDCSPSTQNPLTLEVNKEMKCQATFATPAPVVTTPPTVTTPTETTATTGTTASTTGTTGATTATTGTTGTTGTTVATTSTTGTTSSTGTTGNITTISPTSPATTGTTGSTAITSPTPTGPTGTTSTVPPITTPLPVVTPTPVVTPAPVVVTPPPVVTVLPVTIVGANYSCATTGNIGEVCNYGGREVTNLDVQDTGIVSNGLVKTTVVNTGWVSNFHITTTGKLSGGVVTGYIMNEGIMLDFEFVGMSIIGGTLGGVITNNSRVGGYFQNVTLQANTKITGGTLKGSIKGDKNTPALLEDVRVKSGSKLSGVKLGKNVKLEKGVVVEDK